MKEARQQKAAVLLENHEAQQQLNAIKVRAERIGNVYVKIGNGEEYHRNMSKPPSPPPSEEPDEPTRFDRMVRALFRVDKRDVPKHEPKKRGVKESAQLGESDSPRH